MPDFLSHIIFSVPLLCHTASSRNKEGIHLLFLVLLELLEIFSYSGGTHAHIQIHAHTYWIKFRHEGFEKKKKNPL